MQKTWILHSDRFGFKCCLCHLLIGCVISLYFSCMPRRGGLLYGLNEIIYENQICMYGTKILKMSRMKVIKL